MAERVTFTFGENWKHFLKNSYSEEALLAATKSLRDFLERDCLGGASFLDIGCGSGMFSLAAYPLGARVVSVDSDEQSMECCRFLWKSAGKPADWVMLHGSILDESLVKSLRKADIVYIWGVLHHTGRMWDAVRIATRLVKPNGLLYLAIYNRAEGILGSRFGLSVKRLYNRLPRPVERAAELFFLPFVGGFLMTLPTSFPKIRTYRSRRGMSWRHDARDWLGGCPMNTRA